MQSAGLEQYCIAIDTLSKEKVMDCFEKLNREYDVYKKELQSKNIMWQRKAHETTDRVINIINNLSSNEDK